jgi:hypothetical protein
MDSNPSLALDDTANEPAATRHWEPLVISLAATIVLGAACFIRMELLAWL